MAGLFLAFRLWLEEFLAELNPRRLAVLGRDVTGKKFLAGPQFSPQLLERSEVRAERCGVAGRDLRAALVHVKCERRFDRVDVEADQVERVSLERQCAPPRLKFSPYKRGAALEGA